MQILRSFLKGLASLLVVGFLLAEAHFSAGAMYGLLAHQNDGASFAARYSVSRSRVVSAAASSQQVQQVVQKVTPAVVAIYGFGQTSGDPQSSGDLPWFGISFPGWMQPQSRVVSTVAGTGFFVDSRGYILTNRHVVDGTDSVYVVELADGTRQDAQVIYRDPNADLAIMKIAGGNYPTVSFGDFSKLKVGQHIVSIGNALGTYKNLASSGEVTALHQDIIVGSENGTGSQVVPDVLETSAQLYPGDSGGPMFDLSGNVIGINVAMSTDISNDSFALPISEALPILQKNIAPAQK